MKDEFYIGWEAKAPAAIGGRVRRRVLGLLCGGLLLAGALAFSQRLIGVGAFEWGAVKNFSGVLQTAPYPHLLVARPGQTGDQAGNSVYYLVAPGKFGLPAALARFNDQAVTLKGTLIYRSDQTMLEVVNDSIQIAAVAGIMATNAQESVSLGRQTLTGEIVDSKCFFGVMNPGQLTPHRACAIRCISGGVPPVLLVRQPNGPAICVLLVSADGQPVNGQVLDFVAEPVRITGQLERQGGLLILRADPATYQKL